jgi:uncharacterized protein
MHKPAHTVLSVSMAFVVTTLTVIAGPLEDAADAYKRGDGATGLQLYRQLADRGNAQAQLTLGGMYERGDGVPLNYAEAVKWYRRAADQGDPIGQQNLGLMYDLGRGVPRNLLEALRGIAKQRTKVMPLRRTT